MRELKLFLFRQSLLELPNEERNMAEEHLKELLDRERPVKKSGILGRLRDVSHNRKKSANFLKYVLQKFV